jgi:2-oxoglutarate ferredoxin oxidoreductase subunit beta
MAVKDYLRKRFMPHIWCPGCGHGIVLNGLLRAVEKLGLDKNSIVVVSGIGCSSRIEGYLDFHTLHTLHGRALAFATGVKMGRPELNIIVPMGDGDALAIGGNHFIHAARRNIDMTAIIMNNHIYGMTGGQYSPATGCGKKATTAPYGTIDQTFDVAKLAVAAGATFVARCTTYHVLPMIKILKAAIAHKGFSVVEVLSQCPTYYGRKNQSGSAVDMMNFFKDHAVETGKDGKGGTGKEAEADPDAFEIGIFIQEERPEYCERYADVLAQVSGKGGKTQ